MTDSQIIALFWERNEDAIQETDAVYGRKLYAISDKILHSKQDAGVIHEEIYISSYCCHTHSGLFDYHSAGIGTRTLRDL